VGSCGHFRLDDLILDRSRKLVGLQSPAACARVATPILTSRTTTSSTPSPRTPGAVFKPVRGGRTRMSMFEGALAGSVTILPLRGKEENQG